jgi:hypothetical protein
MGLFSDHGHGVVVESLSPIAAAGIVCVLEKCGLCQHESWHNYGRISDLKLETFMTKIRLLFVDKAQ